MSRSTRHLIEQQIQKARLEGQLDGLSGEGEPLPDHPEAVFVDAAEAAGFRIMAAAGVLPEEIELKKQIQTQRAHLKTLTGAAERKSAMAELARLELRYAIATEARRKFLKG